MAKKKKKKDDEPIKDFKDKWDRREEDPLGLKGDFDKLPDEIKKILESIGSRGDFDINPIDDLGMAIIRPKRRTPQPIVEVSTTVEGEKTGLFKRQKYTVKASGINPEEVAQKLLKSELQLKVLLGEVIGLKKMVKNLPEGAEVQDLSEFI